ncbi:recombinase family protein [Puniceibacterium sediminis]|uniref:Site-specific DNA recombinase n=1 Tax=Puniceibacterium sediminis TaxID=1608407 RepID=A0A238WE60_9RHOB|nr:recombinase family protein [Puniceibacterium sediminis]SNR44876.1 Site-specific DNA recombinase [Puniceibacterium sediminis]
MAKRAVIYARYSSDMQSASSITDQVRLCRRLCDSNGWTVVEVFTDEAMSGASHLRPAFQRMQMMATAGGYDVLVAEALDRLSRDQEHIAGLHKRMTYLGAEIVTKSEGLINEMHIGLGGTMNALFLKQLAAKTRRGLEGRVHNGKSAGGRSYGYRIDRQPLPDGTWTTGDLAIDAREKAVVQRIFKSYSLGKSARAIAVELNAAGIPSPRSGKGSGEWSFSTISGNWKRGTGILNNELYVGRRVWNRQRFVKDPATGKRQARPNPPEEWIIEQVGDLRLIDNDLWESVKRRQGAIRADMDDTAGSVAHGGNPLGTARRPTYLFSGMLKCGCCGASYTLMNKTKYGCSAARNKGTCDNRKLIHRERVETRILDGLKDKLLHPEMIEAFIVEYQREWNRLRSTEVSERATCEAELKTVTQKIDKIVDAISEGMFHMSMKEKMDALEAHKGDLTTKLANLGDAAAPIHLHPSLAQVYRQKVSDLTASLNDELARPEATEALRGLVSEVRMVPDDAAEHGHVIELYGELGAILGLAGGGNDEPRRITGGVSYSMVAGVGFEPTTFRL